MPAGEPDTVPVPVPFFDTLSVYWLSVKAAVTVVSAFIVTVQVPVPVQPPPLQPVKVEPAAGVAVRVTVVPFAHLEEQVAPQGMRAGELEATPLRRPPVG